MRPLRGLRSLSPLALALSSRVALAQDAPVVVPPPERPVEVPKVEPVPFDLSKLVARPGGLTAPEVSRRAVASSPDVRQQQADIDVAQAETERLTYTSLPRVSLLGRYTRLSSIGRQVLGNDNLNLVWTSQTQQGRLPANAPLFSGPASLLAIPEVLDNWMLQGTVSVPLSDYLFSTSNALAAAHLNEDAATLNREATKLEVGMRAKASYYDWARAKLLAVVAEQAVFQARENVKQAKFALSSGRGTNSDVLKAESLEATTELTAEKARKVARVAEQRLRTIQHDKAAGYEIGEDLLAVPQKRRPEKFPALLQEARTKRLEFRAIDRARRSLSEQSEVTSAGALPKLQAVGNVYYARPNPRYLPVKDEWRATWDAGVALSWSPNDWGTSSTEGRSLAAQIAKLQAQSDSVSDRIEQEIADALASIEEAEVGVSTAQRAVIAAEEVYRVQRLLYDAGRGTIVDLLDTEMRLLQARAEVVNMIVAQRVSRAALEHAVGRDATAPSTP